MYRDVHFSKQNENKNFLVIANCYDPNRTSFINLNFELTKKKFFFNTASDSVVPGSLIKNAKNINEIKLGFRTAIKNIPAGSLIHNLTLNATLNRDGYVAV